MQKYIDLYLGFDSFLVKTKSMLEVRVVIE